MYGICLVLHIFYKNATAAFSKYSCGVEIHQTSPLFITFCVVVIYALMHTRNYHLSNKNVAKPLLCFIIYLDYLVHSRFLCML